MRTRIRGPSGQSTIELNETDTVAELISKIHDATSLTSFDVKLGAPPLPLTPLDLSSLDPTQTIRDANLKLANQLLTVSARAVDTEPPRVKAQEQPKAPVPASSTRPERGGRAPTASAAQASAPRSDGLLELQRSPNKISDDPPEIPVPSHGSTLVLRVMPDDNSCLFRALGTCLLGSTVDGVVELRDNVASAIQADPERWNAGILNALPDTYCRTIKSPDTWGGDIDIAILAEYWGICVRNISVQDGHVYSYNEDASNMCIIVYSGIHYDAIALSPSEPPFTHATAPMDWDVKQFRTDDGLVLEKAKELVGKLKEQHYFTDTAGFALKCGICGWTGHGERAAEKHGMETGHAKFEEANE